MYTRTRLRKAAWRIAWNHLGLYMLRDGAAGTNPNGAQCVNLPACYWEQLGLEAVWGNAAAWVGYESKSLMWLPVGTLPRGQAGDVAVIPAGPLTPEGHVVLILDGSRTPYMGAELNYPTGSPVELCHRQISDAAGVLRVRRLA